MRRLATKSSIALPDNKLVVAANFHAHPMFADVSGANQIYKIFIVYAFLRLEILRVTRLTCTELDHGRPSMNWFLLSISLALIVYLGVVMLVPEKF